MLGHEERELGHQLSNQAHRIWNKYATNRLLKVAYDVGRFHLHFFKQIRKGIRH